MGDEKKALTFRRALLMPEYWLMLVTALAGTFGVAWWIAVPLATADLSNIKSAEICGAVTMRPGGRC